MADKKTLQPWQKLWFVPSQSGRSAKEVNILKVGRKWAEIDGIYKGRIDVNTLRVDGRGYSSPGSCYTSKEVYDAEQALFRTWRLLVMKVSNRIPNGVTKEDVSAAAKLLNLEL